MSRLTFFHLLNRFEKQMFAKGGIKNLSIYSTYVDEEDKWLTKMSIKQAYKYYPKWTKDESNIKTIETITYFGKKPNDLGLEKEYDKLEDEYYNSITEKFIYKSP